MNNIFSLLKNSELVTFLFVQKKFSKYNYAHKIHCIKPMKKILLVLLVPFFYIGCFHSPTVLQTSQPELTNGIVNQENSNGNKANEVKESVNAEVVENVNIETVTTKVTPINAEVNQSVNLEPVNTNTEEPSELPAVEHYIKITSPKDYSVFDGSTSPIIYKGEVSEGATKIVVTADFTYLDFPTGKKYPKQDIYTLSEFASGDTTFEYGVKESWNNLGLEENSYTFTAYFEDGKQASTIQKMCYQMEVYYPPSCW